MKKYINFKKIKGSILKKNKVYLLYRNIKTTRLSNKLDFIKLRFFRIEKVLEFINY